MAKKARYRPYAPSDGLGNISLTDAELADPGRPEREAATAALIFDDDDKEHLHAVIGCVNGDSAAAMFYCLQAAEVCCTGSGELPIAIALLKLTSRNWSARHEGKKDATAQAKRSRPRR